MTVLTILKLLLGCSICAVVAGVLLWSALHKDDEKEM